MDCGFRRCIACLILIAAMGACGGGVPVGSPGAARGKMACPLSTGAAPTSVAPIVTTSSIPISILPVPTLLPHVKTSGKPDPLPHVKPPASAPRRRPG